VIEYFQSANGQEIPLEEDEYAVFEHIESAARMAGGFAGAVLPPEYPAKA
jgi:hypothetical protein